MGVPAELFNTNRTPIDKLRSITVGRESLIRRIHESFCLSPEDRNAPHWLIAAPRGMGKTHLLRLLCDRVANDPRTAGQWLVLQLSEEEYWRSYSAPTFLRSVLKQLVEKHIATQPQSKEGHAIRGALQDLEGMKSGEDMLFQVRALMERVCRLRGRRLLIGLENFNSLFGQFKDKVQDAHQLRDFLQHSPHLSIIGTTITTELGTDISSHENPFYRFFRLERLPRLTFEEQVQQLSSLAEADEDSVRRGRVQRFLARRRHALEVVHRLSGGNPRLGVVLYGVLGGTETLVEALELLHELLDQSTPYFQDRMKDLAPMERPLAAAFCEARTTLTAARAARIAGMEPNSANSLITRMERAGFIEPVDYSPPSRKSGKPYQIAEDLFRMWWQYRFDSDQMVRKLVYFLAYVYNPSELHQIHEDLAGRIHRGDCAAFAGKMCLKYVEEAWKFQELPEYFELAEAHGLSKEKLAAFTGIAPPPRKEAKPEEDTNKKIRQLKKKIKLAGANAEDLLELARLQVNIEDLNGAEATCNQLLDIDVDSAETWFIIGSTNLIQNHHQEAQKAFAKVLSIDPSRANVWFLLGVTKAELKDYQGAQEAFEKYLDFIPDNAYAWFNLGVARLKLKDYQGAQEAYQKGLDLDPDDAYAWFTLGVARLNLKDYRGAQVAYLKGLDLDPDDAYAWFNLGAARFGLKDYLGAQNACQKGLDLDPNDAHAWFNLGVARLEMEDYLDAQEAYQRSLDLDPKDANAWSSLGIAKLALKDYQGANFPFHRSLKLEPNNATLWLNLGAVKWSQKDYQGAKEAFQKSLGLDSADYRPWFNLGVTKMHLDDTQGAAEAFDAVIKLNPQDIEAWTDIIAFKSEREDEAGAREVLHQLRDQNPGCLITPIVQFILASQGVLPLEEVTQEFIKEIAIYSAADPRWPELLAAASDALLTGVEINDVGEVAARKNLVETLSTCRPELEKLEALDSLTFVFDYFMARLDPSAVPGGKKMTAKKRGEYALALVPREQNQAIQDLIKKVKARAKGNQRKTQES